MNADHLTPADDPELQMTVFEKDGGPLTKRISLDHSDKLVSDGSDCRMSRGKACRLRLRGVEDLGRLIELLRPEQALALGQLAGHLPDQVNIVPQATLKKTPGSDAISRSGKYLGYAEGLPAFMLVDVDFKGMAAALQSRVDAVGGPWAAILAAVPGLAGAAHRRDAPDSQDKGHPQKRQVQEEEQHHHHRLSATSTRMLRNAGLV